MASEGYLHLSAPNPRPGIVDDTWWAEHAPAPLMGISLGRHDRLMRAVDSYRSWNRAMRPALHNCVRLEAIDGSLRHWRCYRLGLPSLRVYYVTVVHTPAGSIDWLEPLLPWGSGVQP